MKRKHIILLLISAGIIFICISFGLTFASMATKNIIGGASLPTFKYIFFHEKNGLNFTLTIMGIICIITSIILKATKKKNNI